MVAGRGLLRWTSDANLDPGDLGCSESLKHGTDTAMSAIAAFSPDTKSAERKIHVVLQHQAFFWSEADLAGQPEENGSAIVNARHGLDKMERHAIVIGGRHQRV